MSGIILAVMAALSTFFFGRHKRGRLVPKMWR
jgi:hypothetical protein